MVTGPSALFAVRTESEPVAAPGVYVTTGVAISAVLLDATATLRVPLSPEPPTEMPVSGIVYVVRSTPDRFGIGSSVGGSFTALTESTKESLAVEAPSETVTVITDVPDESDAGIIVSVRFVPAPSKSRFDCGTKPGFPLPALTLRRLAGVSAS